MYTIVLLYNSHSHEKDEQNFITIIAYQKNEKHISLMSLYVIAPFTK